jgi:CBS-domain-containing membrane protein
MAKNKRFSLFDRKFRIHPAHYMIQCSLATVYIIILLMGFELFTQTALIATLGATAFIVFVRPRSYTSRPRVVIGGYLIGAGSGVLMHIMTGFHFLDWLFVFHEAEFIFFAGLGVGISIFLMAITNTEHPPGAALALSLVLSPWNIATLALICVSVMLLVVVRVLLGKWLINLM